MALGFGMFGLGEDFTDPHAREFAHRVHDTLGIDIVGSPYRYFQTDEIISAIDNAPEGTKIFVWGTSLGGNNVTKVCSQTSRTITGAYGFQASQFGDKYGITPNIQFLHFVFNPFIALGSYKPQLAEGNGTTIPLWTERWVDHPGDQDRVSQDMFLDSMARRLAA